MNKLLIRVENYKSVSTDFLENYVIFIKNINSIIIYLYYKLTVFESVSNGAIKYSTKFNEQSLEKLKKDILSINRKNFDFIKEIHIKIISDILSKQKANKEKSEEYIYVKYDNTITEKNGLLNLFVLAHMELNIKNKIF